MASEALKQLILGQAFKRGAERRKAAAEQKIRTDTMGKADEWFGNEAVDAVPEERGQFNEDLGGYSYQPRQAEQAATGVFQGLEDQAQINAMNAYKGMLGQDSDRYAQKEAMSNFAGLLKGAADSTQPNANSNKIFSVPAPVKMVTVGEGKNKRTYNENQDKVMSVYPDPTSELGYKQVGDGVRYPRDTYKNTGTEFTNVAGPNNEFFINNEGKANATKTGTNKADTKRDSIKGNVETIRATQNRTRLYEEALGIVRSGADTGPLANKFMSVSTASALLDNMKSRLGLEEAKNVTLTPVSDADMKLLLQQGLPDDLQGEPLAGWIERRIAAEGKLMQAAANMNKALSGYLDEKGNYVEPVTEDEWLRANMKKSAPAKPEVKYINGKKYYVKDGKMKLAS